MEKIGLYLWEEDPCSHGRFCHDCGYFQIWKEFYKLKHGRNGRHCVCSECHSKHRGGAAGAGPITSLLLSAKDVDDKRTWNAITVMIR